MKNQKEWLRNYQPPIPTNWQGRTDSQTAERFFQIVQCIDLQTETITFATTPTYGIIGFCVDEGIKRNLGRPGAAAGPSALRQALGKLPMHFPACNLNDYGDITCIGNDLESAQKSLGALVAELLQHNIQPLVFGGGHETAWGHYQGIAQAKPGLNLGIINFDAHFDLRPLLADKKGTSGTPFLQIATARKNENLNFSYLCIGIQSTGNTQSLFNTAKALGVEYITAENIHLDANQISQNKLDQFIQQHEAIYVSVCLDVFASHVAPGVSAPQPLGLFPWQVIPLLRSIVAAKKYISFDIVELSPPLDYQNQTAQLAANLVAEYLTVASTHGMHSIN